MAKEHNDLQQVFGSLTSPVSKSSSVAEIFGLTWSGGAAILATYSVSSSTAFMPFIFGRLGYTLAPILLALYFCMCGYLQSLLIELGSKHSEARTMPDLAGLVAGRFGRNAYHFLQILNQQLFMPTALWFVVTALKKILYPGVHIWSKDHSFLSCNVVWLVAILMFALVGANVQRRFGHAGWLCKLTCLLNIFQVALITIRVYMNPSGSQPGSPTAAYAFPSLPLSTNEKDHGYWVDLFTSASLFCYCYVPVFIATEAMQEMEDKVHMQRALWVSTGCMYVLYALAGICPVLAWGWQREDDILNELSDHWIGRTANATLMVASGTDFLITAISLNQRTQETLNPGFDVDDWSLKACGKWFCYSTPSLLVSFVMLCFIPKLASLSGLMTAFVVPFSQIMGPALLSLMASRKGLLGRRLTLAENVLTMVSLLVGLLLLGLGASATIYSIFWMTTFEGNFFCEQVAG